MWLRALTALVWCAPALVILRTTSASAQISVSTVRAHAVTGIVTDSAGNALSGAEVRLVVDGSITGLVRTAVDGQFSVVADTTAQSRLQVRRLGFHPNETILAFPRDFSRRLEIVLVAAPPSLAGVEVVDRAAESSGLLQTFYDRRRTNAFGRFFTRDAIAAVRVQHVSEVLRTLPGVTLMLARGGGYRVRMRSCTQAPLVWIDGVRLPQAEIDDVAAPDDIAGMEVYASVAGVPAQFMDRSNGGCGTILIWTRTR
jgi:Carboxypeptidase regulatory-like domain/TonB-dependent Receptor Plug Domain